jgi:hypothetical protein
MNGPGTDGNLRENRGGVLLIDQLPSRYFCRGELMLRGLLTGERDFGPPDNFVRSTDRLIRSFGGPCWCSA